MKEFSTPKTDHLVEYIQQELIAGNITNGVATQISSMMIDSAHESADKLNDIFMKELNKQKTFALVVGIILGSALTGISAYFYFI